jgi:hypothetical protein
MSIRPRAAHVVLATSLALVGLSVPGAAVADTPGCVTRREYRAAETGWQPSRVRHRFDTGGELVSSYAGDAGAGVPARQTRAYQRCSGLAAVHIDYLRAAESDDPWRLSYKSSW